MAYHIDRNRLHGVLGTIAGDDTIFVAPATKPPIAQVVAQLREILGL